MLTTEDPVPVQTATRSGHDDEPGEEADMKRCDECTSPVAECSHCEGQGRKRWKGECTFCRGTGMVCSGNSNHRW